MGYGVNDHLLAQTMVNGAGAPQFKRANSSEVKSNPPLKPHDFPAGKFVDNKPAAGAPPNVDLLRKQLANKNKQVPVSERPVVSAGNGAQVSTPSKQLLKRPASGRTPNRSQINQQKYKELLNQPAQAQKEFKPIFISDSSNLMK